MNKRIRDDVMVQVAIGQITQAEAARICGVSKQAVSQYFSYRAMRERVRAQRTIISERVNSDPQFVREYPQFAARLRSVPADKEQG